MERHTLTTINERGNEVTMSHNMVRFNTGNQYSAFGQRITVVEFNNHQLFMLDHDRGLTYLFDGTTDDMNQFGIMYMYNHNQSVMIDADDIGKFYDLKRSVEAEFDYNQAWKRGTQ